MSETIIVWVLVISSWQSTRNMAEVHGPFADNESCERVLRSTPFANFDRQCVEVKVPRK